MSQYCLHLQCQTSKTIILKNGSEPYDSKEVDRQFLEDCSCWLTMKERIAQGGQSLRKSMVTPWSIDRPISIEEFQQQMEEVSIIALQRGC